MGAGHVFTYGSLMFGKVWHRVVAGRYDSLPASLAGYRRQRVRDQPYPALERLPAGQARCKPGTPVQGLLYLDVDVADIAALDAFEGADYRRIRVPVVLERPSGTDRTVPADTYLFIAHDKVEPGAWDPDLFEREMLERFLRDYPPPRQLAARRLKKAGRSAPPGG